MNWKDQISAVKIHEAVKKLIAYAAYPPLPLNHILQGWQNRSALPVSDEYAVMSIIQSVRHGTPVEERLSKDQLLIKQLYDVHMQIDFCSSTDVCRIRAQKFCAFCNSYYGAEFLVEKYSIRVMQAEEPKDLTFVNEADQYERRFMTTLHIAAWDGLVIDVQMAESVKIQGRHNGNAIGRIEDVDAFHKNN